VLVTFVLALNVTRTYAHGQSTGSSFHVVVAVVIVNVADVNVPGAPAAVMSCVGRGNHDEPSGLPSTRYVQVGVAPIVVTIRNRAACNWFAAPRRCATFVDTALPVCAFAKFATEPAPVKLTVANATS
jgi:hypothetical protein